MRISDWSSDVCSSDLLVRFVVPDHRELSQPAARGAVRRGQDGQSRSHGRAQLLGVPDRGRMAGLLERRDHRSARQAVQDTLYRARRGGGVAGPFRAEEPTYELQSLMRISSAVLSLNKTTNNYYLIQ